MILPVPGEGSEKRQVSPHTAQWLCDSEAVRQRLTEGPASPVFMSSGMGNGRGWVGAKDHVRSTPSLKISLREFPGGSVGRTPRCHCQERYVSAYIER